MPWLVCEDRVIASVEIARVGKDRRRGLRGRDDITGALLIERCGSVHTIGMRFDIDIAYLDGGRRVLDIVTMPPGRIGRPRPRARSVLEARAGAFESWGVAIGEVLDVRLDA